MPSIGIAQKQTQGPVSSCAEDMSSSRISTGLGKDSKTGILKASHLLTLPLL